MASGIFTILNVANLDRSIAFYKGLGLKTRIDSAPMGELTMRWLTVTSGPEHALMLFEREFPGADPEDVAWASGDVGKGVLVNIGVPNAQKTHAAAKAAGGKPEDLMPNPWGGHSFNVADPDGYYLNLSDRFPPADRPSKKSARKAGRKSAKKGARKSAKKASKKARRR